jgi:hypothetical protein
LITIQAAEDLLVEPSLVVGLDVLPPHEPRAEQRAHQQPDGETQDESDQHRDLLATVSGEARKPAIKGGLGPVIVR